MIASSPVSISLWVSIWGAWHICGLWENKKHLTAEIIESREAFATLILVENCPSPCCPQAQYGFWATCQVAAPCCSGFCFPWLTAGLCRGCFLLTLTHPTAETKGQRPRQYCVAAEDIVQHCKGASIQGHSSSQTSGHQGTGSAGRGHKPGKSGGWWQCPECTEHLVATRA